MGKIDNILTGFKNLMTGKEIEQEQKRKDICGKCPHSTNTNRCMVCGCYLPAKVKSPKSSCPVNKW